MMICDTANCSNKCPAYENVIKSYGGTHCKIMNAKIKASEAKADYYIAKRKREDDEAMR